MLMTRWRRASVAAELVIDRIQALSLRVAVEKTEAIVFGGRGWRLPRGLALPIAGDAVQVKANIKYLGLVLDRKWDFKELLDSWEVLLHSGACSLTSAAPERLVGSCLRG